MLNLRQIIKSNAHKALQGHWGRAVAIIVIGLAIGLLFSLFESMASLVFSIPGFGQLLRGNVPPRMLALSLGLTGLAMLLYQLVMQPVTMGVLGWFYQLGNGRQEEVAAIFIYFESLRRFGRSLWLSLLLGVRALVLYGLGALPGGLLVALFAGLPASRTMGESFFIAGGLLVALGVLGCGIAAGAMLQKRYFLAPYLLYTHPTLSAGAALRQSVQATKGYKGELLLLDLGYLPGLVLCLFYLPALYVLPLLLTARGLFARYLLVAAGLAEGEPSPPPAPEGEAPN